MAGIKRKSKRQTRFLFSEGSPLTRAEKRRLASEIRRGTVKVGGRKKRSQKR